MYVINYENRFLIIHKTLWNQTSSLISNHIHNLTLLKPYFNHYFRKHKTLLNIQVIIERISTFLKVTNARFLVKRTLNFCQIARIKSFLEIIIHRLNTNKSLWLKSHIKHKWRICRKQYTKFTFLSEQRFRKLLKLIFLFFISSEFDHQGVVKRSNFF